MGGGSLQRGVGLRRFESSGSVQGCKSTECSNLSLRDICALLSFASMAALPPPNLLSKRLRMHPSLAARELMTENIDSLECLNARLRRSIADICSGITSRPRE